MSEIPYKAMVSIENSVSMSTCDEATNSVNAPYGSPLTYCWNVTNVGNTALLSIRLENLDLQYVGTAAMTNLLPGESTLVVLPSRATGNLINRCTVTATPGSADGNQLMLNDVSDSDISEVDIIALNPQIAVTNNVYRGLDNGSSCGTATERVEGIFFTDVTYCFSITNEGDTSIDTLQLWNDDLEFSQTIDETLIPGESTTISFASKITSDLTNEVFVKGRPILSDGTEIVGKEAVVASASSSVSKLTFSSSVSVTNRLIAGKDETQCEGKHLTDSVEVEYSSPMVYCFSVTNTGETYLASVSLANKALVYFHTINSMVAPGTTVTSAFLTTSSMNLTNTVLVEAVSTVEMWCLLHV